MISAFIILVSVIFSLYNSSIYKLNFCKLNFCKLNFCKLNFYKSYFCNLSLCNQSFYNSQFSLLYISERIILFTSTSKFRIIIKLHECQSQRMHKSTQCIHKNIDSMPGNKYQHRNNWASN